MIIALAGAGALGSQIAMLLAHPDLSFVIMDDDRVERHNIPTSAYSTQHIGALKAVVLGELLYRKCGARSWVEGRTVECKLTAHSAHSISFSLVIDTFDNVEARGHTCGLSIPTVHVGVSEHRTGEIMWDESYTLPVSEYARGENPVCTHALGKRILRLTAVVAVGVIEDFISTGEKRNYIVTERPEVLKV